MTAGHRSTVLLADNNEFYRQVLTDFYGEMGFDVRSARDGLEALEMLEQKPPDLLLLDLIMPRLDGARLCSLLKCKKEYCSIPVIILSGILPDEIERMETIKADAYIGKMPLPQMREVLKQVSENLLLDRGGKQQLLFGFENMYRREVVLELLQDRKALQEILESLSEGVVTLASDHRVLSTNKAFQRLAARPASDLLCLPLERVFPESPDGVLDLFEQLESGARIATESIRYADRQLCVTLHRIQPLDETGNEDSSSPATGGIGTAIRRAAETNEKVKLLEGPNSTGYTLLVQDITERTKAEQEREVLRRRLILSEKMRVAGQLVSGVAHELNNPLTGVLGFAELMLRLDPTDKMRQGLERIKAQAERCKCIVENLQTFARNHKPRKDLVDINEILKAALELRAYQLKVDNIQVALDLEPKLPKTMADPHQLEQVFLNIIINAHQAIASNGPNGRLTVRSRSESDLIIVEMEDSGHGIPQENLERIFDPFFTTRDVGQGTGLGLSVCYGIIEEHKGRLSAANVPGGGAIVAVKLPLCQTESPRERQPTPVTMPTTAAGKRILVVDDEPFILELLVQILSLDRHRVNTAPNGQDAFRRIESDSYDLIITDLKMPVMNGQDLFQRVHETRPLLASRMIFITGDVVSRETTGFLEKTGNRHLRKPFQLDAVLEVVRGALSGNSSGT